MPSNFAFLQSDSRFDSFSDTCVSAEKTLPINASMCAAGCRMALEFAVKWLYTVDSGLKAPYQDNLKALVCEHSFQDIINPDLIKPIEYIIRLGNNAVHRPKSVTLEQALLSLKNLHAFMDFVSYCYGTEYNSTQFDETLIIASEQPPKARVEPDFEKLKTENEALKAELTKNRREREKTYTSEAPDLTEFETRMQYIDVMLIDAGWERGRNWIDEYPIDEMPNGSGFGRADYVLFGDDGRPLAVVEAKRTSIGVEKGRQQAVLYADFLEKKFNQRPVIFLTNGYETRIWSDKYYPDRLVSGVYSKRDLEQEFNKMLSRTYLDNIQISDEITNRYYQKEAIRAVCDEFDKRNRRKTLLVMATGSGKTRTVISLADVLTRHGWVKNLLFLADRNALVTQAKRSFNSLLPNLSLCNLSEGKDSPNSRAVFTTYQTMLNAIDDTKGDDGKRLFTPGHFDLIIVDEAHRSIYNKYKDIFTYFDALLVGLTATPKSEIDKNTYGIFGIENGVPTYGYELSQAVDDMYLVEYKTIETKLKFMFDGITYADLPEDEKQEYEDTFADEDGNIPSAIDSSAINEWIYNKNTIRQALNILMTNGQKVDYGSKIGKTIIFAKSHEHAKKILEVFYEQYPEYDPHFVEIIDNYINYAQSLIDKFSSSAKLPQIAISVDMLDTGIDVHEILNLVFFKKVFSKSKFWQMVGRGTRLCEDIFGAGEDKKQFYIFDFCNNFEFFRVNKKGRDAATTTSITERIFDLKVEIAYKLQELVYQTEELTAYRNTLVSEIIKKIEGLNRDNFAVKQHFKCIDKYKTAKAFDALTYENTLEIAELIAPMIGADDDDIAAVRFDALMYQIELVFLVVKSYTKAKKDVIGKAQALSHYGSIPEVKAQGALIDAVKNETFWKDAGIGDFEKIRENLRGLMKFIKGDPQAIFTTNFTDDVLSTEWHDSELENDDLKDYKLKVSKYIREHQEHISIHKLKTNIPLTIGDIKELENILWGEVGTKEQYQNEYGDMPLGELVRSITGLDVEAANAAFSEFLSKYSLDDGQSYFIKQVINYVVKNGMMKDVGVLRESPFNDMGGISEIFEDAAAFMDIRKVIDNINRNVEVAA